MVKHLRNAIGLILLITIFSPWSVLVFDAFMWLWTDRFVIAELLSLPYTEVRVLAMLFAPICLLFIVGATANALS